MCVVQEITMTITKFNQLSPTGAKLEQDSTLPSYGGLAVWAWTKCFQAMKNFEN